MNPRRPWVAACLCIAAAFMVKASNRASGDEPATSSSSAKTERHPDVATDKPLKIGSVHCSRILYLGNSITLHGPAPQIGWTGNWGMAASAAENDYVHLLTKRIASAAGGDPEIRVRNIADFERNHEKYDIATSLKEELAFRPELVILAIGENVPALKDAEAKERFRAALQGLLRSLDENGHPAIVVRSCFWANPPKDDILEAAASEVTATFVNIRQLGSDPTMSARSERKIEHDGVAAHPGDKGMKAIADAIWKGLETRAGVTPGGPATDRSKE